MKKQWLLNSVLVILFIITGASLMAQDGENKSNFSLGADVYTNYVWRGTKYGTGPSVQPSITFTRGELTIGVWGAFDAAGYAEADPYISYTLPFGLSLGLTDYYYPGLEVFDFSKASGGHALEINTGFEKDGFSFSANYILNESGGAASAGGDMYFQAGYSFTNVELFVGAGNGWHTSDGNFNICNIGFGTSKEITLTENFSIPVIGQIILNPEREQLYIVVGFSF